MICSKHDYLAYLEADRVNLGCPKTLRNYLFHDVWRYQRVLRRLEYQLNCKRGPLHKPRELWLRFRLKRLSKEIGVYIKPNNFGPGLAIVHEGMIRVHKNARIGANCRIHVDVNIGASGGVPAAPRLGHNVYIAPGAKIFGDITIADGVAIGANAVVNRSFCEPNVSVAGVPARKISDGGAVAAGWTPDNTYMG